MKIPPQLYEPPRGAEKLQIDTLVAQDEDQFLESVRNQLQVLRNGPLGVQASILDRVESIFEKRVSSSNVGAVLELIVELLEVPSMCKLFYMVEHLLEVLRISDDLHHIRLAMKCFPRLYGQTLETSPPNHKYLTKFLPRVIYLLRIFYEHSNLLNPQKVFLKDYFNYNQQDLVLRFTTPTVLTESYQRLQTNLKHSPLPAQAPDAQSLVIPNVADVVQGSTCTLDLAKNLLLANESLAKCTQQLCPLWEIVRFRLLLAARLQQDRTETAKQIIKLHLIQLELYLAIDQFCQTMAEEQAFLDLIFPEKVDFRSLFDTYFDMFKMDLGGEFHFIIIQVLSSLMRTETFSEDDECFSCLRSHDEQIMKMVQDVLSNGESQVLPLATAKHPRFAMQLLSFCASEIGILVLSRNTVISGIVGSVLKYLRELVPTSNPDTTKECISLIGRLSRRDEFQREYNLLDEILTLTNAILLTPEIDSFDALAALYIQQLNELFREEGGRRANRANAPTIARKIAETSLMKHLKILPQINQVSQQALLLIGHLGNEVPMLIGRLIDSGAPVELCKVLMNTPIDQYSGKLINAAMSFFYNISLKEEGYELFNASAMQLLETILTNLHFSTRDMITAISISIVKYMSKIEKAVPQILKTMHGSGERILHEINKRRDEILALEDHNEACLQFIKLTQHLQNYSQLLHKLAHQCPPSILEGIADAGVFTTALKLLSIPQFEQKNDIVRMLKQLSHADEVSFPKLVANELKDSLGELDQILGGPIEKVDSLPLSSVYTLYEAQTFFSQQGDLHLQFALVSKLNKLENVLEVYKSTSQSPLAQLTPAIGVKCAALFRLLLKSHVVVQAQQLREKCASDETKISAFVFEAVTSRQRLSAFLQTLRVVLFQIGRRNAKEQDFLPELICWLVTEVQREQEPIAHLFRLVWLRDLCNLNADGRSGTPLEFLRQLVQGGLYRELKKTLDRFFQLLIKLDDSDPLINEVISQTASQYSKMCFQLYLPRIDIPPKNPSMQEEAYGILYLHVDELYQTLQLVGTYEVQRKDKSYLQIFQTLLAKASSLLTQNLLDLLRIGNTHERTRLRHLFQEYDTYEEGQFGLGTIEELTQNLQMMGYSQREAQIAIQNIDLPDVTLAVEWIQSHQEEIFQLQLQDTIQTSRPMQEERPATSVPEESAELFQKLTLEEFKKKVGDKIEEFGHLFLKQILYYEGFEDKISDFLIFLLNESYTHHKDSSKPQYSKDMIGLILAGIRQIVARLLPNYSWKLKTAPTYIQVPEGLRTSEVLLRKLNILLQVLIHVSKIDIQHNKENAQIRSTIVNELIRLSSELTTVKEVGVPQTLTLLLAYMLQFVTAPEHEEFLKQHRKEDDMAIQRVKSSAKRRTKSETQSSDVAHEIVHLVVNVLKQQHPTLTRVAYDLLTRCFTIDATYASLFILQLKGLELLLRSPLKGNNFPLLVKFAVSVLQDEQLLRAQIEAKLKKAVFDYQLLQLYGQAESDSAQKHESTKKHTPSAAYPMVHGQPYYGLPLTQPLQIPANHPSIMTLLRNKPYEALVRNVIVELFEEIAGQEEKVAEVPALEKEVSGKRRKSVEAKPVETKALESKPVEKIDAKVELGPKVVEPIVILQLRNNAIHQYQTAPVTGFQKYHYEGDNDQTIKKSKSVGREKKVEQTPNRSMTSYHHNPESQVFIRVLLQQIVYSFLSELRGDLTNGQPFYYELLQVLHVLLRRYPVFVPKVAKFNCAKALRGAPELVWALLTDEKEQPKKVSFLSFLVRLLVPLSTNKLSSFVLELCLDSSVLIVHNQQFVTFASEIRRKVLGEIYSSLEEEIARTRKQKQRLLDTNIQTHKFVCYSLLLTHLCQSKPIARMVFKNATDNTCSFNFPKLYIEALKSVPLQGYYNFDKVLDFLTETLAVLYNLAIYNLFQKPRAFIEGSNKPPGNDQSNLIKGYLATAPGSLSIEDIVQQMVPHKSILYKDNKAVFKGWPLPPLSFQANIIAQDQQNNWRDEDLDQIHRFMRMRGGRPNDANGNPRGRRGHPQNIYEDLLNFPLVEDENSGDEGLALDDELDGGQNDGSSSSSLHSGDEDISQTNTHDEEDGTSWVTSDSQQSMHSLSQSQQQSEHQQASDEWTDEEDGNDDGDDDADEDDEDDHGDDDDPHIQMVIEDDEVHDDDDDDDIDNDDDDDLGGDSYGNDDEIEVEEEEEVVQQIQQQRVPVNLKQDVFKTEDPSLLKSVRAIVRFQVASSEFHLVLEDLNQVIKLIYDIGADKLDTPANDDEVFWATTVRFLQKVSTYEEGLDKPYVSWWMDLVQANQVVMPVEVPQRGGDQQSDLQNNMLRIMNNNHDRIFSALEGYRLHHFHHPQIERHPREDGQPRLVAQGFMNLLHHQAEPPQQPAQPSMPLQFQPPADLGNQFMQMDWANINVQHRTEQQIAEMRARVEQRVQQQQQQPAQTSPSRLLRQAQQPQTHQALEMLISQLSLPQQPTQQATSLPNLFANLQTQQPPQNMLQTPSQIPQQQSPQPQPPRWQLPAQQRQQSQEQVPSQPQPAQQQPQPQQQIQQPPPQQQQQPPPQQQQLPQPQQQQPQPQQQQPQPQRQQPQPQQPQLQQRTHQQEQQSHLSLLRSQFPKTSEILRRLHLEFEVLQVNDIDLLTFEDLPEEFQLDILQNLGIPSQSLQPPQQQTIDPAFLSQLPPELQFELMQPPPDPQPTAMDTITFIQTLTPDLREEVLLTLSNEILDQLPIELRAEAQDIRMRANQRAMHRLEEQQMHEQMRREMRVDRQNPAVNNRGQPAVPQVPINQKSLRDLKEHFLKDKHLLSKLGNLDDEFIEALLNLLYVESHSFVYYPINLLASLQSNPVLECKILDALFFILKQQIGIQDLKQACNFRDEQFPPSFIVQRYTILHDPTKTYENVSLKILYLFSKLPQNSIQYFYELASKKQLQSIQKLQNSRQEFLQQSSQLIPLLQLIHLLPQQRDSQLHLSMLVSALYNLTRKNLKSTRADRSTEPMYQVKLDPFSIHCICQVLLSTGMLQKTIKQLSLIINHLCVDSQNLHLFIQEIRSVISEITRRISITLQKTLKDLAQGTVSGRQLEHEIQGEKILINVFSFVRELFEMEQNRQALKDTQKEAKEKETKEKEAKEKEAKEAKEKQEGKAKQEGIEKEPKEGEMEIEKSDTDTTMENIRKSFQELITDDSLYQLWLNTTNLLTELSGSAKDYSRIQFKLAPILESFFIIYSILNPYDKKRLQPPNLKGQKSSQLRIAGMQSIQEEQPIEQVEQQTRGADELFNIICEKGKVVLNMMIKEKLQDSKNPLNRYENPNKKSILSEPLGVIFLKQPKIIDFENKQKYFKQELKQLKLQNRHHVGNISLRVRRKDIFIDSFHHFSKKRTEELRGKLHIEFTGEEGVDAGGVTREWYMVLSREIFNPNYALFQSSMNGQMFQPSSKSFVNPDHLRFFKFIGRVIGKALYDGYLLDSYFTRSFYKHMLGQSLTFHDMEDIDLSEYNSMKKILENDVTHWGLSWTYNVDTFGTIEERDLIPGGRNKPVTEENKREYVQTYCYQKMAKDIKEQTEAFLSGFYELIPQNIVSIFEWKEMELMLCGLPDIDIEDLKENVEYHNYTAESKIIKWLWELLDSYDKSKRASFLQFVTGTSKVPLDGFKDLRGISGSQKLSIHKKPYNNFELPTSHTCFNQLDLPDYPTREVLKEKLELAILEGKEGFGFA